MLSPLSLTRQFFPLNSRKDLNTDNAAELLSRYIQRPMIILAPLVTTPLESG